MDQFTAAMTGDKAQGVIVVIYESQLERDRLFLCLTFAEEKNK